MLAQQVRQEQPSRRVTRSLKLPDEVLYLPAEMRPGGSSAMPKHEKPAAQSSPSQQQADANNGVRRLACRVFSCSLRCIHAGQRGMCSACAWYRHAWLLRVLAMAAGGCVAGHRLPGAVRPLLAAQPAGSVPRHRPGP
jgi:hypothetical protein